MDSSNSGSFQSSTGPAAGAGADYEEHDSTTHSIPPSFFNNHFNHLLHPPPPPTTDHTTFFFNNPNLSTTTVTNPKPGHGPGHGSDHHHHHHNLGVTTTKNPKKRARVSRRAPTTVLTTDTTNFRQMVQEFTGIPTSPFTARRLDLFRPTTAQKVLQQPSPFNNINDGATSSSSYSLHPSNIHELQKLPSTLLDLQNPMVSFQSLLQTSVPQQSNDLNGLESLKRWRDQNEKLGSFEGSKLDSGLENHVVVASRSGGDDQVQVGVLDDSEFLPWKKRSVSLVTTEVHDRHE